MPACCARSAGSARTLPGRTAPPAPRGPRPTCSPPGATCAHPPSSVSRHLSFPPSHFPAISLSRHLSTLQDLASCAPQGEALGGWYGGGVVVMGKTRPSLTAGDTRSSTPASPAPPRRPHCQHAGCPGTRQRRLGPRSGSRCAERSEAPHRVVHRGHEAGPRARVHIRPELDQGTASAHLQPRCAAQRPAGASRPARRSEGDPTRCADESSMA